MPIASAFRRRTLRLAAAFAAVVSAAVPASAGEEGPAFLVRDIAPGAASSEPRDLLAFGEALLFAADDGALGRELWRVDGVSGQAALLRDIDPGAPSAELQNFGSADGMAFFEAPTVGLFGTTLWRTDGTAGGTRFLLEPFFRPIPEGAENDLEAVFGAALDLFVVEEEVRFDGLEVERTLWANPHQFLFAGELKIFRHPAGFPDPSLRRFGELGNMLFFNGGDGGNELWKTDGSRGQTRLVATFASSPRDFAELDGVLYFSAETPELGRELWRANASTEGVELAADLRPGDKGSSPRGTVALADGLVFAATSDALGEELWAGNGAPEGTGLLADLNPGPESSGVEGLAAFPLEGLAFFSANDGSNGREPWATDGTASGTRLLGDLAPGGFSSNPGAFVRAAPGVVVFSAFSEGSGREPWISDGTPEGTRLLQDLNPGPASSDPAEFVRAGERVFFSADDGLAGRELWAVPVAALGTPPEASGWRTY